MLSEMPKAGIQVKKTALKGTLQIIHTLYALYTELYVYKTELLIVF